MKRFTETTKWNDPWYRKMSPAAKLLWGYMTDFCNSVGVIDLDLDAASFHIGEKIKEGHIEELEGRVQLVGELRYYIPQFIPFQYGELSPDCRAHQPVFKLISALGLVKSGIGYDYPRNRINANFGFPDEEHLKSEKTPVKPVEALVFPDNLTTIEFEAVWKSWLEHLKAKKKTPSRQTQEEQLKFLQKMGPIRALESIRNSIRNGWQGLFEPDKAIMTDKPENYGPGGYGDAGGLLKGQALTDKLRAQGRLIGPTEPNL